MLIRLLKHQTILLASKNHNSGLNALTEYYNKINHHYDLSEDIRLLCSFKSRRSHKTRRWKNIEMNDQLDPQDKQASGSIRRHNEVTHVFLQQSNRQTRLLNNEQQFSLNTSQRRRKIRKCWMWLREMKHKNEMIVEEAAQKRFFIVFFLYKRQKRWNISSYRFLILTTLRA
jgi:hypothetical protein